MPAATPHLRGPVGGVGGATARDAGSIGRRGETAAGGYRGRARRHSTHGAMEFMGPGHVRGSRTRRVLPAAVRRLQRVVQPAGVRDRHLLRASHTRLSLVGVVARGGIGGEGGVGFSVRATRAHPLFMDLSRFGCGRGVRVGGGLRVGVPDPFQKHVGLSRRSPASSTATRARRRRQVRGLPEGRSRST